MTTRKTTQWAAQIWQEWRDHQSVSNEEVPPPTLDGIDNKALNHWLPRCLLEVRKQDGNHYTGGSLYSLSSGIQRYVCEKRATSNGEPLDIFKDSQFNFRSVMNSVLKDLHKMGIGTTKKKAQVISNDLEEQLWNEGALGDDSPDKLLNTLVFSFGLHFALCSGTEHRQLRPDMIVQNEPAGATPYLVYTKSGSKNNSRGLNQRKVKNKSVKLFANTKNEDRCAVRLYKKYMSLCPSNAPSNAFYLQPSRNVRLDCWYQARPMGHNTLGAAVKKLCNMVGERGYFTLPTTPCAGLVQSVYINKESTNKRSCPLQVIKVLMPFVCIRRLATSKKRSGVTLFSQKRKLKQRSLRLL